MTTTTTMKAATKAQQAVVTRLVDDILAAGCAVVIMGTPSTTKYRDREALLKVLAKRGDVVICAHEPDSLLRLGGVMITYDRDDPILGLFEGKNGSIGPTYPIEVIEGLAEGALALAEAS